MAYADSSTEALAEEQAYLDTVLARRDEILDALRVEVDALPSSRLVGADAARRHQLLARMRRLEGLADDLVFGRLDALDGTTRRIGPVGIPAADDEAEPLVVDWRAPVARAFYTATPLEPQGMLRRRHLRVAQGRVVAINDEPLDGVDSSHGLVGEAALLAVLSGRRTGRLGDAVATLQREQDDIVRADTRGPLVVQGGPGTGKTVVALHRAAYLLFTRPVVAERGVLVVGPTTRFLDYVSEVLPSLGESGVQSATCESMVTGVTVTRQDPREVVAAKGEATWWARLQAHVESLVPTAQLLSIRFDGERLALDAQRVQDALRSCRSGGRAYHPARRLFRDRIVDLLTDQAVAAHEQALASAEEGFEEILARVDDALTRRDDRGVRVAASSATVDGVLDDDDVETLRERLRKDPGLDDLLDRFWPSVEPEAELCRILGVDGFSAADLPLLDALRHLLGSPQDAPEDATVGHVVVDEGQELSPMQWLMLVRRCPTRSFTIVGDIDQATSPHPHTAWADVVGPAFGDRVELRHLTICYRTPTEVMALAGPVLEAAGSLNEPPRAVRSTGIAPWSRPLSAGQVREALDQLRERYAGGAVGVVASTEWVRRLRRDGVDALTAAEAKGLEFDATLLLDPGGIVAEPRGWNALYVALTRCTQELGILEVPGSPSSRSPISAPPLPTARR